MVDANNIVGFIFEGITFEEMPDTPSPPESPRSEVDDDPDNHVPQPAAEVADCPGYCSSCERRIRRSDMLETAPRLLPSSLPDLILVSIRLCSSHVFTHSSHQHVY